MATSSNLRRTTNIMNNAMTPPMASRSRSSSLSSSFDESYFSKTYVPLSSLPTPPLSSHSNSSTRQQSPEAFFSPGEISDPDLLGPAIHLTNLIPSSTSLTTASVPLVHAIITRANLPLETVALAVCILDSLNSRFALQWRKGCPLITQPMPCSFGDIDERIEEQHIDSVLPELIVLSALILAVKFLDDAQQTTKEYAEEWGKGLWTCEQINFTQWSILENLGYRLLPLWEHSIILEALGDMERAGQQHCSVIYDADEDWDAVTCFGSFGASGHGAKMSDGRAVLGLCEQLTPAETPMVENIKGTQDVSLETRSAFYSGSGSDGHLQLADSTAIVGEPFPITTIPPAPLFMFKNRFFTIVKKAKDLGIGILQIGYLQLEVATEYSDGNRTP
ncbi:hypothetical protein N431DRAFT_448250 [Stipitochalara longipes BDJ]|nr:hypothetical protein N431DRAFT_448250 [Stipitochalara longipes BDJ]